MQNRQKYFLTLVILRIEKARNPCYNISCQEATDGNDRGPEGKEIITMMKHEFEALAIRGADTISPVLYSTIERMYSSDNDYHAAHGGIYETKTEFVKRVFGGKVNTAKTILAKITAEAIKENRYALRGCPSVTDERLTEMDAAITAHLAWEARQAW